MKQFAEQKELNSEELQLVVLHNPRNVSRSTVTEGRAVVAVGMWARRQTTNGSRYVPYLVYSDGFMSANICQNILSYTHQRWVI